MTGVQTCALPISAREALGLPADEKWFVSPETYEFFASHKAALGSNRNLMDAVVDALLEKETIDGLEYHVDPTMPEDAPPLVGDFTSTLLSRPVDFSKYGVVYASTGKNLGPSGLLVVIARKDLLTGEREMSICPGVMSWSAAAKSTPIQNIWNTPNVFGIRALQLVLEDCKAKGGVAAMRARATRRAWSVYDIIDANLGVSALDVIASIADRKSVV